MESASSKKSGGKFQGKVVLITGASSGIGAATAVAFVTEGAKVSINGRNAENLAKTAEKCYEAGAKKNDVLQVIGDVTQEPDRNKLVADTIEHFEHIDILVNNAGRAKIRGLVESSLDDLDGLLDVHLRAVFALTQKALPSIIKQKGAIINVSSVAGTRPIPHFAAYSIAKATMDQYTKILALELADKGVRVNSINPGAVKTNLFGSLENESVQKFFELAAKPYPNKRVGAPEEVAKSILFLSSEETPMLTGSLLTMCGAYDLVGPHHELSI